MTNPVSSKEWLEPQVDLAMHEWARSQAPWTSPAPPHSVREQKEREDACDRALEDVRLTCRKRARDARQAEERLTRSFARFASEALNLGPDAVDLLTHGFLPVGMSLARWAHRYDPALNNADIAQACRNAWTACGMQPLFGAPLCLTGSILAYSLLYPYTDNYLDQCAATHDDKLSFSRRFRTRLHGGAVDSADGHEAHVWEMVRLIEDEFPRQVYREVFDALLAIHSAQEESLHQLEGCGSLAERELLRITCAKGGSSVLADAYLARGTLDPAEREFAFLWGVLLQLGDDLQDVQEDLERGSDTLFTRSIRAGIPLDALVEQLLNFSNLASARMDALPHGTPMHKNLLRMSSRSLILMAVGLAHAYFTPAFLARMEPCSPFRFAFLRARRATLDGDRGLFQRLFGIVLNSDDTNQTALPVPLLRPLCEAG